MYEKQTESRLGPSFIWQRVRQLHKFCGVGDLMMLRILELVREGKMH